MSPDENYIARLKQHMNSLKATSPCSSRFGTSFVKKSLMQTSHVFVRRDSVRKLLEQPYDGPFKVISHSDKYFVLDLNGRRDTVSIDHLKAAHIDQTSVTVHSVLYSPLVDTDSTTTSLTSCTRSGRRVRFPSRLDL